MNFSLHDVNFSNEPVYIKIDYTVSDFIEKGVDKLFLTNTMCFPNDKCPGPKMIDKFVMLPKESAVNYFPPNSILIKQDGRLIIHLNDFTPYDPSHGQYERMVISYTDLKEERVRRIFNQVFWLFLGISIPVTISLLKWFFFDRKRESNKYDLLNNINRDVAHIKSDLTEEKRESKPKVKKIISKQKERKKKNYLYFRSS